MFSLETPVYLVHPVVNHRLFVAAWGSYQACLEEALPERYLILPEGAELPAWVAEYALLECEPVRKTRIYRKTRQAELPLEWQLHIQAEQARLRRGERSQRPLPLELQGTPLSEATPQTLKKLYRQLARHWHPDQGGDAEVFLALQRSYEYLLRYWGL